LSGIDSGIASGAGSPTLKIRMRSIVGATIGRPDWALTLVSDSTTSLPATTSPKQTCEWLSQGIPAAVTKNCTALVRAVACRTMPSAPGFEKLTGAFPSSPGTWMFGAPRPVPVGSPASNRRPASTRQTGVWS
jgi:hypothetical protein